MKLFLPLFAACVLTTLAGPAFAAKGEPGDEHLKHSFSLLPKTFQKNPALEMTAFTTMTDYGRTVAAPSSGNPAYYEMHDGGMQMRGEATGYNEIPSATELVDTLQRTLADSGYLPAKGKHKPTILLVYFRGAHDRMDRDTADQFPDLARRYVMERALLIGGQDYAHKLEEELNRPSLNIDTSVKHDYLKEQALEDLYYVVVSAYNYEDAAHGQHKLLWRTTMTVNSRGISMKQGMPALIVMGENFFGRETHEPMMVERDVRSGTVKLGPLNVLEVGRGDLQKSEPAPAPTPAR